MEEHVIEAERGIDNWQQGVGGEGDTGQSAIVPGGDDCDGAGASKESLLVFKEIFKSRFCRSNDREL